MGNRNATPILDTVRRQRGELLPYGGTYTPAGRDLYAYAATPEQLAEAERMLSGRDPLTLET